MLYHGSVCVRHNAVNSAKTGLYIEAIDSYIMTRTSSHSPIGALSIDKRAPLLALFAVYV